MKGFKRLSGASKTSLSTQAWFPIQDIHGGLIHRKDGAHVAAIRVTPVNIFLLTEMERIRKIKLLEEVLNGIEMRYQIMSIARPVDLDAFIHRLSERKQNEMNRIKARLLTDYMAQAAAMSMNGKALEREFYVLIDRQNTNRKNNMDQQMVYERVRELASLLNDAELPSHVCSDDELRELLFIFCNHSHAAYERSPQSNIGLSPIYRRDAEDGKSIAFT
ncbi:hypothetical protein [Paenibacillus humicola]|uniref:hypothetical protein n=1 Tax=Paenibacillus humicola TaxID=3110540 RepID=UPI00237A44D2|nr:hypothetical protein [Paenibacillus humicola]